MVSIDKTPADLWTVIPAVTVSQINQALDGHLLLVTGQAFIEWDGHQIIRHPGLAASLGVHEDQIFGVFQDSQRDDVVLHQPRRDAAR